MLGMGWQEIFLVAVIAVIVVGPKELPRVLRTVSYWIRKLRGMAREFQSGVEDVIRETELQDLRKELEDTTMSNLSQSLSDTDDLKDEVKGAMGVFESTIEAPKIEEAIRDVATEATEATEALRSLRSLRSLRPLVPQVTQMTQMRPRRLRPLPPQKTKNLNRMIRTRKRYQAGPMTK